MRSHEESTYAHHISQNFGTMKEITIQVEDSAYECVLGMLQLCQKVEVVSDGECVIAEDVMDLCVAKAIGELRQRRVFRYPCDYTYIMMAFNEEVVKGLPFFYSPMDFIAYLQALEFESLPGKTTLYDTVNRTRGRYPNWIFDDNPKDMERMRRINVVRQFLSAFGRAKRDMSEGLSEK